MGIANQKRLLRPLPVRLPRMDCVDTNRRPSMVIYSLQRNEQSVDFQCYKYEWFPVSQPQALSPDSLDANEPRRRVISSEKQFHS